MCHLNQVVPVTVSFTFGGSSHCVIYLWWIQLLCHLNLLVPVTVSFISEGSIYCAI
mgnify:CR=1 FL=1